MPKCKSSDHLRTFSGNSMSSIFSTTGGAVGGNCCFSGMSNPRFLAIFITFDSCWLLIHPLPASLQFMIPSSTASHSKGPPPLLCRKQCQQFFEVLTEKFLPCLEPCFGWLPNTSDPFRSLICSGHATWSIASRFPTEYLPEYDLYFLDVFESSFLANGSISFNKTFFSTVAIGASSITL